MATGGRPVDSISAPRQVFVRPQPDNGAAEECCALQMWFPVAEATLSALAHTPANLTFRSVPTSGRFAIAVQGHPVPKPLDFPDQRVLH